MAGAGGEGEGDSQCCSGLEVHALLCANYTMSKDGSKVT